MPPGLVFREIEVLSDGAKKAQVRSASYEVSIPSLCEPGLGERIEQLLAAASWMVDRSRGRPPMDMRPLVLELALRDRVLRMRLSIDSLGGVGPRDVLAALGLAEIEWHGACLCRTVVEVCA